MSVEPPLAPVRGEVFLARSTNTADSARLDISSRGFWTRGQEAFFDVRVITPDASSYSAKSLEELFRQHENQKRLQYAERIVNVERGDFCPLVFTVNGATAPACSRFLKRLCSLLADSTSASYSSVMAFYRCRLSFALLRSAILCVRGARSSRRHPVHHLRELAMVEGRVDH